MISRTTGAWLALLHYSPSLLFLPVISYLSIFLCFTLPFLLLPLCLKVIWPTAQFIQPHMKTSFFFFFFFFENVCPLRTIGIQQRSLYIILDILGIIQVHNLSSSWWWNKQENIDLLFPWTSEKWMFLWGNFGNKIHHVSNILRKSQYSSRKPFSKI